MSDEADAVSLWVGVASSATAFEEAIEIAYSDDGDFEGSEFTRAFGIDYYDEDFQEAPRSRSRPEAAQTSEMSSHAPG